MDAMSKRQILLIKNYGERHYHHEKYHHNYTNKPVYDDFVNFLMMFLCFHHKSKLS
jgi:hypothetical protein